MNHTPDAPDLEPLLADPTVAAARDHIRETDARTVADLLEIVQVPAPPFGEAERGEWIRERFRQLGLADVASDEVGNVLARLPGPVNGKPPVILAAHLDTVFPPGTEIRVRREGAKLRAPGIADNARGLAALLAVARALLHAGARTARPVVFVATVGEEGVGDLRGVKHLFREGSPWRGAEAFITLDGTGIRRVVTRSIGSRRLRATVSGPGGHSWADWGVGNPVSALGIAVAELARMPLSRSPRSALTVGRIAGGTSVNAIPDHAWLELDIRSEAAPPLRELETRVRRILSHAVAEVNSRRRRGTPSLTLDVDVIGDRPTGETPFSSPVVRAARAATRAIGEAPELVASSTDANAPMALGIPAIAMGAGGDAGGTHTTEEWYSNERGPDGIERVLLTLLGVTGVA
ncbi:MAG TPA: M20/M25/M40 family metallo-hydrolase [Longimicrobiales bacterium]|nr:M20/M25/M40 family metallo-hydrolase [Longimicrobiales bacterium]